MPLPSYHWVDVPEAHLREHSALPDVAQAGTETQHDGVRIHSGKERPLDPYVAVRYRDYWFRIDQGDLRTKRALNAVMLILTLVDTGTARSQCR
jgi:hypothetical protein